MRSRNEATILMLSQSNTVSEGEYAACLDAWWKMMPVLDFKLLIPRISGVSEPNILLQAQKIDGGRKERCAGW